MPPRPRKDDQQSVSGWQTVCRTCGQRVTVVERPHRLPPALPDPIGGGEDPALVVLESSDKGPVYCPRCGATLSLAERDM